MAAARRPETRKLDQRIAILWNKHGMNAKEIKVELGLENVWRVYNTRKRYPSMRRARVPRGA
jgi:hypothetical protein